MNCHSICVAWVYISVIVLVIVQFFLLSVGTFRIKKCDIVHSTMDAALKAGYRSIGECLLACFITQKGLSCQNNMWHFIHKQYFPKSWFFTVYSNKLYGGSQLEIWILRLIWACPTLNSHLQSYKQIELNFLFPIWNIVFALFTSPMLINIHVFSDTAAVYQNEGHIGTALTTLLPKYGLKRSDIFITSKLGKRQGILPSLCPIAIKIY